MEEAFEKFVAEDFIHHNQYFEGSRVALKRAMEEAHRTSPNRLLEVKQILEEGDRVMTYSHVKKDDMQIAVAHIFRFREGKITEAWDLGQVMEKDSPNQHGMF